MTAIVPTDTTSVHITINTPIGELKYEAGYPTKETAEKLYDGMDFQRDCQAYMWSMPLVTAACIRLGLSRDLGVSSYVMCDEHRAWEPKNSVPSALSSSSRAGQEPQTTLEVERHQRSAGQRENH